MIYSDVNIWTKTIEIKHVVDQPELYHLGFKFDSLHECIITVYQNSTEARDPFNYPMYFLTPKNLPAPSSYKFKQGIN